MKKNYEAENIAEFGLIIGRNPVMEAMKSGRNIEYILVSEKTPTGSLIPIISKAKSLGIQIRKTARQKLDAMADNIPHQGIIAVGGEKQYCNIYDILELANKKKEDPFIVIADGIEDPHNLGALIRTAECAGVHGIIIPKRRASGITPVVEKSSAGAVEHMLIAKENIATAIDTLKKHNVWVYGAEAGGEIWGKQTFTGSVALVVGSEGRGISRIAKEKCDRIISLPMFGKITSLNVSAASAVIIYEIVRQRYTGVLTN